MAPKLYINHMSPPSRAVISVAKALDIQVELEEVDMENVKSPEIMEVTF